MEHWKTIAGFEEYAVSNLGRVKRLSRTTRHQAGWIMSLQKDGRGYLQVGLCKHGKVTILKVHRLVAQAFIPNPKSLPDINHLGNTTNNRASKLEWRSSTGHAQDQAKRHQLGIGVCFDKRVGKWMARYSPLPYTEKFIGYFDTKAEAKAARDEAVASMPYIE
jgi:NUMOD4 motif